MAEKNFNKKKGFSLDWLVQGVLAKLGETFDSLTGRRWQPTSSLATSELIERLKRLLDSEVRDLGARGKYVPHNLKLKMQWDKFSTDSEEALKKLETELLTAAVDHINDNRYHTFAPLKFEIKPDYFTEGVKLNVSFDSFAEEETEAELNVTMPDAKLDRASLPASTIDNDGAETFIARYSANGTKQEAKLRFLKNQRLRVGRTRENDLSINDTSVSKVHSSLVLNSENALMVADTGSTNGTFVNGQRISYGNAAVVGNNDTVSFGSVDVTFEHVPKPTEIVEAFDSPFENSVMINGLEFKTRTDTGDTYEANGLQNDASEVETRIKGKNKQ